ncbi:unnamed protein product, partial [Tetraodon nigroviridis]
MKSFICLVIFFFAGLGHAYGASHFRICAFNLHSFGEAKAKKSSVMRTLTQIIARCDVTLLQEVRDRKERALSELLERLNRFQAEHRYQAVASQRLGRSDSYQEQYVFVYRADTATVTGHYQSPDNRPGDVDAFAREPFVVRFRAPKTAIKEFVLIPQHTAPANTSKELDALYDVLQDVRKMWKTEETSTQTVPTMAKRKREKLQLITDKNLHWLIADETDTTVRASTSCSYDRIVVHGQRFASAVVPSSAKAFNFQMEYGLTEEQALEVSDHYPVEVLLKNGAHKLLP